ncbi:hypothetical protein MY8738_005208 [Beauveria namnaoensis]
MTQSIVDCLSRIDYQAMNPDESSDPSLINPAIGNPILHSQILRLSKSQKAFRLEELLRGSQIYVTPPAPKPAKSPEYIALMAKLRRDEDARAYQRMINPPIPLETFKDRFPNSARSFAAANKPTSDADIGDDDVTYNEIHRQVMLLINFLVSIAGVAATLWILGRWWSLPARLLLTMGGSILVAIAEVAVYGGYVWRMGEAKRKEDIRPERKEVMQTWIPGVRPLSRKRDKPLRTYGKRSTATPEPRSEPPAKRARTACTVLDDKNIKPLGFIVHEDHEPTVLSVFKAKPQPTAEQGQGKQPLSKPELNPPAKRSILNYFRPTTHLIPIEPTKANTISGAGSVEEKTDRPVAQPKSRLLRIRLNQSIDRDDETGQEQDHSGMSEKYGPKDSGHGHDRMCPDDPLQNKVQIMAKWEGTWWREAGLAAAEVISITAVAGSGRRARALFDRDSLLNARIYEPTCFEIFFSLFLSQRLSSEMAGAIDPSERLALQLMQDDLEEFKSLQKGNGRADEPDDFSLALQMQSLYLTNQIQSLTDREYCLRIQPQRNTEPLPAPVPKQPLPSTAVVAGPSRQARTSAQANPVIAGSARQPNASNSAGTTCKTPVSAVVRSLASASLVDDEASGSTVTNDSTPVDEDQDLICVACDGAYGENLAVSVSCGHVYCWDCLACLFKASTTDESLFPPRCCKEPISLDDVKKWLPKELVIEFEDKEDEFTSADRTYCSNVNCSKFISPYGIHDGLGNCEACDVWTCTFCKGAEHDGACPDVPDKKEILAVAKENGWQQCYRCQHLVELNHGCNHIM